MALLGIIRRWHLCDQAPLREVVKKPGISRNTVRRYSRSETTGPAYAERQSASAIDSYAFQLSGWLNTEAAKSRKQRYTLKQLHEDLTELGFKGAYDRVAAFARQWSQGQTEWVSSARKRTLVTLFIRVKASDDHFWPNPDVRPTSVGFQDKNLASGARGWKTEGVSWIIAIAGRSDRRDFAVGDVLMAF